MRISVLAGLLALPIFFGMSNQPAEASSAVDIVKISETSSAVDELIAVTNKEEPNSNNREPEVKKHVVEENETLSQVAEKHETTWKRIYDKNVEIEDPDVINPGEELIIPAPEEEIAPRELPAEPVVILAPAPTPARSSTPAPARNDSSVQSTRTVSRGSSSGNLYSAGYCTWYVKNRKPSLPNNLGNASSWFSRASAQGMAVGYTPQVGAAAQRNNHVAYVEAVNGDGTITISDMNYRSLYTVTTRVVNASEWRYIY